MDLVGACRAFVSVGERGSFTLGAAAARMPQPVASRRIAALERHLGGRLFDRTGRGAALTEFGRDMLPSARRLVALAESMEHDAARALRSPLPVAVPEVCAARDLALLGAQARQRGLRLDLVPAGPAQREELLRSRQVRAAVVQVAADAARWRVPLGLASVAEPAVRRIHLDTLRPRRGGAGARRGVWIQPEDDVPQVRDRLMGARDAAGLMPSQVAVAPGLAGAAAEVLGSDDLLLCSPAQAREFGLCWRPLGGVEAVRGYALRGVSEGTAERVAEAAGPELALCLGADDGDGEDV
ncbi:LysR family transcriptional regulator [Nocardiopsis coralliicola]